MPRILFLLGLAASVWPIAATHGADVIRVRADPWMPFNGGPANAPGYVTEVLEAVFKPQGIEIQYESLAWEKSLTGCRAGKVDAVPCANKKEGAGLVFPEEPISEIKYCIFTLKSSTWKLTGEDSFKGHRLGYSEGYSYWDVLDRYIAGNPKDLVPLASEDVCWNGIQKLQSGEVELLPECPQVFYWTLKAHGLDGAKFRTGCLMAGDPVYVVFRADEKGRAWAKIFDAGLRALRANGQLATILHRYGLEDWK